VEVEPIDAHYDFRRPAPKALPQATPGRILPETDEPGIWAGKAPTPDRRLAGVPLPDVEPNGVVHDSVAMCTAEWTRLFKDFPKGKALEKHLWELKYNGPDTGSDRACLVASMWGTCLDTLGEGKLNPGNIYQGQGKAYDVEYERVNQLYSKYCLLRSDDAQKVEAALNRFWKKYAGKEATP
jgi:hypothetical protein